jgi:hypothetical protein
VTAQVWIDKTRDLLLGGTVETLNRLNGDITSDAAQFTVEFDAGSIVAGSIVEIGTELAYVTSVAGTTVSVMRGYGGSTAAAHTSTDIIRSNPQYPGHMILTALNDDLNDLSSPRNGLYQVATVTFTYNSTKDGYNLAADVLAVRRVTWVHTSSDRSEPEVRRFVVKRNRDTAVFASGVALILQDLPEPGQTGGVHDRVHGVDGFDDGTVGHRVARRGLRPAGDGCSVGDHVVQADRPRVDHAAATDAPLRGGATGCHFGLDAGPAVPTAGTHPG